MQLHHNYGMYSAFEKVDHQKWQYFFDFFSHGGGGRCCVVFSYGYMYTGTEWPLQLFFV